MEARALHLVPAVLWWSVLVVLYLPRPVQGISLRLPAVGEHAFVGLNDQFFAVEAGLVRDELLSEAQAFQLGLLLQLLKRVRIFTTLCHHVVLLLLELLQMVLDFGDREFGLIHLHFLAMLLVVVGEVPCVQHIILNTLWMLRERLQVMRSDEPLSIAVFLLGHFVHDVFLIVLNWHVGWVGCCDVFIDELALIVNGSESLGWVELRSIVMNLPRRLHLALLSHREALLYLITILEQVLVFALACPLLLLLLLSKSLFLHLVLQVHCVALGGHGVRVKLLVVIGCLGVPCGVFVWRAGARALRPLHHRFD